jgi:hypothetical protein
LLVASQAFLTWRRLWHDSAREIDDETGTEITNHDQKLRRKRRLGQGDWKSEKSSNRIIFWDLLVDDRKVIKSGDSLKRQLLDLKFPQRVVFVPSAHNKTLDPVAYKALSKTSGQGLSLGPVTLHEASH